MIAALAAAIALAEPSREALIARWLRANRTHTVAHLQAAPPVGASPKEMPNLQALAQQELATAGRYQLTVTPARPEREPWWARLWDWISAKWHDLWNALFSRVHVGREAAASAGDVLLVLVVGLLIWVVVRILRNVQIARTSARSQSQALATPPDPQQVYDDARSAANRGDYGNAALLLFAATIALLSVRGAIDASRSATVGDLRRGLRAREKASVVPFDAVVAPFVQRAYAERPVAAAQWTIAESAFLALRGEP